MQKKDLIELGITSILLVAMVSFIGSAIKKSRQRKEAANKASVLLSAVTPTVQKEADKVDDANLYNFLEQKAKAMELKRDPFTAVPIAIEKNVQSGIVLTGILWDKIKPLAVINGEILKKGSRVGNKTLIEIRRDRVILTDGEALSEVLLEH